MKVRKILSDNGYKGISLMDLYSDLPQETSTFDSERLLVAAFPQFARSSATFIPVFRYLSEVGINDVESLQNSKYDGAKTVVGKIHKKKYFVESYASQFHRDWASATTSEIIANNPAEKVALFVPFQKPEDVDLEVLREFLKSHTPRDFRDPYSSFFRKLCCFYDRVAFGF